MLHSLNHLQQRFLTYSNACIQFEYQNCIGIQLNMKQIYISMYMSMNQMEVLLHAYVHITKQIVSNSILLIEMSIHRIQCNRMQIQYIFVDLVFNYIYCFHIHLWCISIGYAYNSTNIWYMDSRWVTQMKTKKNKIKQTKLQETVTTNWDCYLNG